MLKVKICDILTEWFFQEGLFEWMKHMFVLFAYQCIWSVFSIWNNYSNYKPEKWVAILKWIRDML